jgi:hypothetical protein
MSLLTEAKVRARAQKPTGLYKSVETILTEHMQKQAAISQYDIFLSHAFDDRELLTGTVLMIEDLGYTVYIDWKDDTLLNRKQVTPATAAKLRERMKASRCLFYSVTPTATESTWVKWELGYKDGDNNRTAILPIIHSLTEDYGGQEFLELYPYVSDGNDAFGKSHLWIHRSRTFYVEFDSWLKGRDPFEHT